MNCVTTEAAMYRIVDLLADRGYIATYEFPGYVDIHLPGGYSIAFGDANYTWNGQILTEYGDVAVSDIDVETGIPTECLDAHKIVSALIPIIDKAKESLK